MNAVFFVLIAIMGSQAEAVKVRAIRRRLIEYPYELNEPPRKIIQVPPQPEYAQRVPINEDPRMFNYLDRNGIRYMHGPTYGGSVNQNRRVIANAPNILWTNAAGPDFTRFGEGRLGPNEYTVDQSLREGVKERINYSEETDTNFGYKEISLNPFEQRSEKEDKTNYSLGEDKLSITDSNQSNGTVDLSETNEAYSGSVIGEIEIGTDENLADKVSGNDKQHNNAASLLSRLSTAPGSEEVNTVDQSKLNVEKVEKKPIRYVANKHYLLPPLSRRFYTVDEIKTDWENETSQINMENVNNTKEDNSRLIRLTPERQFISLDGGGKYTENQSESNRASLKNIVNVLDVTNDTNIAQVRLQSEEEVVSPDNKNTYLLGLDNPVKENVDQVKVFKEANSSPDRFVFDSNKIYHVGENKLNLDKKTPLKGIVQVMNVANPKHLALIRLEPEDNDTSTNAEINNAVNQESGENSLNENYTYTEKEGRDRLPIYLYRFGQNTYLYQPTDQNVPWKQVDISKLLQSRRESQSEPYEEKNSEICLACETLLKLLSKNPNILKEYGLLGDENNKNTPTDGISWNYLEVEGKKEPISLEYYQPSTIITKTGNKNNRRMNTEKELVDIYGYNKLEYPQILSPVKQTSNKFDLIIPKPQVNPQYDSKEDYKNILLTLVGDEPNVRLNKIHLNVSKSNGETSETRHVPDSKDDVSKIMPKTPDSPVIYVTPILKTPHEEPLPISDELLTQNVPILSTVYDLQDNNVPEMLLKLKAPHLSKISTAAVPDSEEWLMPVAPFTANSEEKDISNAYNSELDKFLPLTPADGIDVSKTYVQFPIPQNGTSQKLLPSETPNASSVPVSYNSGPHIPKSRTDNLLSSKAPNASETSTTDFPGTRRSAHNFVKPTNYVQFETDRKHEDARPKAPTTKTPEKSPDTDNVSTAYASLATDRNTIPRQLLPVVASDVTERLTKNTLLEETTQVPRTTDRKYENTVLKEMQPSNAPVTNEISTTHNLLATEKDWSHHDLSNELLPSGAPNTPKTASTPTPTTKKWITTPENMLPSKEPDAKDKFKTITPRELVPSKDPNHGKNIPQHSLPTERPDASKSPTTNAPSTSTEEILSSRKADMTDKSVTITRTTTPGEFWSSKTPGTSKTPAQSTTETHHWSSLTDNLLSSSEPVSTELSTAYTLAPTDQTFVEEDSVPSKPSDELEIPVAIIYDSTTPEQLPTSPHPDTSEISTANNQIATDWVTVTEKPEHSVDPDEFKIPTTEIPNDLMKTRNGKPEVILFSEYLDTPKVVTAHTPTLANFIPIAEESESSVKSNVFNLPTSQISNDWNKPEELLVSEELGTSKVPAHNSVPTDWISITGESGPSLKTRLPDYWNKPKELLFSEEPGMFEVPRASYSSMPIGWTAETDNLRPSKKPNDLPTTGVRDNWYDIPERWQSYTQRLNTEYDQTLLLNFEGTTPEEQYYILQVMNVLMPDLLRLYYSRCYKEVNEELLKRLKVAINSVREKNCETSQRYN